MPVSMSYPDVHQAIHSPSRPTSPGPGYSRSHSPGPGGYGSGPQSPGPNYHDVYDSLSFLELRDDAAPTTHSFAVGPSQPNLNRGLTHSASYLDVKLVEELTRAADQEAASAGRVADSADLRNRHSQNNLPYIPKVGKVSDLMNGQKAIQEHENEMAEIVIVCEPEASSLMMGGLHPRGSLFERFVNIDEARRVHGEFRRVLREHGLKVLTVRDILSYNVDQNMSARVDLEELVCSALEYEMAAGHTVDELTESDRYYLSDEYKRHAVEQMGTSQLIDTLMVQPKVHLTPSYRDTGLSATYTFEPLSNLVYTRDQQITTCKGIVMGRLRSTQRQREVKIMLFCVNKLGLDVVGEIRQPGFLEGGDFFPLGTDLAMFGIGLRSNMAAAKQLMDEDLLGTRRFAVVRDEFDKHQDRMHLDCVFSIISDNCAIMLESIMGPMSPMRRMVDEYVRSPDTGAYTLSREGVEFSAYVRGEGYAIIPIRHEDQLAYACNILNLGENRIISVHAATARQMVKSPHFQGDVSLIDFSSVTSMYGSVHCASQVVKRMPRRVKEALHREQAAAAAAAEAAQALRMNSLAAAAQLGQLAAAPSMVGMDEAVSPVEAAKRAAMLLLRPDA